MFATHQPKVDPQLPPLTETSRKVFDYLEEAHRQYLQYLDAVDVGYLAKLLDAEEGMQRPPRVDLPLTYDVR